TECFHHKHFDEIYKYLLSKSNRSDEEFPDTMDKILIRERLTNTLFKETLSEGPKLLAQQLVGYINNYSNISLNMFLNVIGKDLQLNDQRKKGGQCHQMEERK